MLDYDETKIRPLETQDLDHIMAWVNDPDVVGRYAYFTKPFTREQEASWLEEKIDSETDFFFAIENAEGDYVGNVAVEKIHWPAKNARLSLTIGNKSESGKGHGYRAINLMLDRAFNKLGLHKVYLIVTESNAAGRHLYQKCGFKDEGCLRDHYVIDGEFVDMYHMSLLEDEFRDLHK